ncbi:MAG: ABC transporter permease subunit [Bacteroidetes bacterium]|nr:ABC transporter permease subunit [Bacteroidota bacterium]
MIKLLKIEFKKILTYKIFWILTGLYFLFLTLGLLMAEFMINKQVDNFNSRLPIPFPHVTIYFFPWIWQNLAFFATIRYVLIFPAIVIIILITNEFTFKTIRQNMINGMSKAEFLASKLLIILLISLIMTILLTIGTLVLGISHTSDLTLSLVLDKSTFMIGFFITMLTLQVYALFFGFLLRNTGLSIALFTLYLFIVEPILYYFLKSPLVFENNISPYLPLNAVLRVTEYPNIQVLKNMMGINLQDSISFAACCIPLGYAAVMIGITYWVLLKRDL